MPAGRFYSSLQRFVKFLLTDIFFSGLLLIPVACSGATPTRSVTTITVRTIPTPTPYPFRTSIPNTATLSGKLIVVDPTSLMPGEGDAIYLAPVTSDSVSSVPQFVVGEVPQADVNEVDGTFVFTGIKPGKYMVMVVTKNGAQIPARYYQDKQLAVVTVDESGKDKTTDLGLLSFP